MAEPEILRRFRAAIMMTSRSIQESASGSGLILNATSTETSGPNPTIEPYTTDLNGVDQVANKKYQSVLFWFLGGLCICVLLVRILEVGRAWARHKVAMGQPAERQVYWRENHSEWWPWIKQQVTYAPLWKKRHNREFRLSSAVTVGTLPSRFHTVLLTVYFLSNFAYCAALDYTVESRWAVAAQLRGRSGVLALANMVPLIILAARNNPLIPLLKVSFDTYNLLHRWIGRVAILEAIIHTLAWMITQVASDGWSSVKRKIVSDPFIGWGTAGTVAMLVILVSSPSPVRHAFYETFLNVHIILALVAVIAVWIHCDLGSLPQLPYAQAIFVIWLGDRLWRVARIVYHNYSQRGFTYATIHALPGEACHVTLHLPNHVDIKPGSHAYLRFWSLKAWESHPFSIAWVEHKPFKHNRDTLPSTEKPILELSPKHLRTSVSFIISAHTGMTRSLYNMAIQQKPGRINMLAAFEGPYAGHHSLISYGHCVLFAGSSGITHQISHVRHLLREYHKGTVATRKITLIWTVRELEHLEWVRPWMDDVLSMPQRREVLTIKLFITRPKSSAEVVSPSSTVQMYPGRPNVRLLLQNEVLMQTGAMCVTVCGPGGLADSVREVVRELQGHSSVDFVEEAFTW